MERSEVMKDFLAWGSQQERSKHGGDSFPYGTIGYWVGKYLEDHKPALTHEEQLSVRQRAMMQSWRDHPLG